MTIVALAALVALMNPVVPAAQPADPVGGSAAPSQTVRAAGMPLQDGALPPGSLTVRLVRGAFSGDLVGIPVTLDLDGRDTRSQQTGAMGRAEFAHLPIGAQVRASAVVNGERLESEPFPMPADSGVRVLLMAAVGDSGGAGVHAAASTGSIAAPAVPQAVARVDDPAGGATAVRVAVVSLTILVFMLVAAQQWRRRHS